MRKNLVITRRKVERLQNNTEQQKKSTTPIKIFKTPQSLRKGKNAAKNFLTKSSHHKKELLSLANAFGIECFIRHETANSNQGLPQETFDKVKSYYLESSWACK